MGINSILSAAGRGVELLTLIIIHIQTTRYLGASDFGLYNLAITYIMVLYPLVDLGMDHIFVREINKDRKNTSKVFHSIIFLKSIILIPSILIIAIFIVYLSPETKLMWGIIIEGVATLLVRQFLSITARAFFFAFEELKYDLFLTLLAQISKILILLYVIHNDLGFIAVFFVILAGDFFYGVPGMIITLIKYEKFDFSSFKTDQVIKIFLETAPVGLTLFLITASFHIDKMIIKYYLTNERIGIFAAAYNIISTLISSCLAIIWIMMPRISRSVKDNTLPVEIRKGAKYITILSIPLMVTLFVFAERIVALFGKDYPESANVLKILCWVLVFRFCAYLFDLGLIAIDKQKITMLGAIAILVINSILDLILVPKIDIYGACAGTMTADISCSILLFLLLKKYNKNLNLISTILKPSFAGICYFMFMNLLKGENLILVSILGLVFYLTCLKLFRVFDKDDIDFVKSILARISPTKK
jgi:polysaccharide transporter, PST family